MKPFFLLFLILSTVSCAKEDIAYRDAKGDAIVCFGDSLTEGFGAGEGEDYPSVLRRNVSLKVINAGVSGNSARDALARLDNDVLAYNPKMVIITLGGNDFLRKIPLQETLNNMEAIIDRIHQRKAMVVWVHVRAGLLGDDYLKDFKRIAKAKKIILIENILKEIMLDVRYKSDQIHPNAKGYALMAQRIITKIRGLI